MESYRTPYQKYAEEPPQSHAPSQHYPYSGYPIGGMPPMRTAVHSPPMHHTIPPYNYPLPPPPHKQQQQQQMSTSSRIITEPGCSVFRSNHDGAPVEHTSRQIISVDGKVFIEHVPAHNVVFVPIEMPPTAAIHQRVTGSRVIKARPRVAPLARPSNVFFKYRSVKQRELQMLHPRLNQTVISRMVAEHWKREPKEVKDKFKKEYDEDMKKYELHKKMNRNRPEFEYFESDDLTTHSDTALNYYQQQDSVESRSFVNEPASLGLTRTDSPASPNRTRSFTMPELDKPQHDISRLIH
ncbi:hypothetical protein IWW36_001548 [Coemansia brasiliensis]|uniref:HMG box domain-containing protein n=1 Tax=Coemansia brasiliensis TaxID=2650707 RepID=A0A9W8M1Y0_9FUNG|nr:hypothetical protein IWW36_001548 [Coemansia brasiliensis]